MAAAVTCSALPSLQQRASHLRTTAFRRGPASPSTPVNHYGWRKHNGAVPLRTRRQTTPGENSTGGPNTTVHVAGKGGIPAGAAEIKESDIHAELGKFPVLEPFGQGLMRDIQNRLIPHYWTDITDGFGVKSFAASGFLFCACLCAAVAFGVGVATVTNGQIGVIEMILSTSICGFFYSLTCGQPVALTGFGGAHMAFMAVLYTLSEAMGVEFLPAFAWVGLWAALFLFVYTMTSVSNLVLYFTRFTDETFSALSSIIFMYEASKSLSKPFMGPAADATTAFLSTLVAGTTLVTVLLLSNFRKTALFVHSFRETVADFAPVIGVTLGSAAFLAAQAKFGVGLPVLSLPDGLVTSTGRPWLIDIFAAPVWVRWASAIPAVMLALLLFMDQVITTRLVNAKDNNLKKGYGYHLDLAVISIWTAVCSIFGLPWMTAATVPSLNHARALATLKGGDVESLLENRVSGAFLHLLMGLSVLVLRPALQSIPLPVFMGLFLYLGFSAARNNKLVKRMFLQLVEPNNFRKKMGKQLKKIRPKKDAPAVIARYTAIQAGCLALLWSIKSSPLGILFPVLVALLVPIRILCGRFFQNDQLEALDDAGDALAAGRNAFINEVLGEELKEGMTRSFVDNITHDDRSGYDAAIWSMDATDSMMSFDETSMSQEEYKQTQDFVDAIKREIENEKANKKL